MKTLTKQFEVEGQTLTVTIRVGEEYLIHNESGVEVTEDFEMYGPISEYIEANAAIKPPPGPGPLPDDHWFVKGLRAYLIETSKNQG